MGTKRVGWARIRSLINENANELKFLRPETISVTGTRTLLASESGATIIWTLGSAHHITLPEALPGRNFKFILGKGAAANHTIISLTADKIFGKAFVAKAASADSCNSQIIEKAGSTVDKVHFKSDATTHGGSAGDTCELVCLQAGFWLATVMQTTTGTVGATVSTLAN